MPRFISPAPEFDFQGESIAYGELYFYNSGTNNPKTTYSDASETIANPNPVLLDADGRAPNIFFTGTAKVRLLTSPDAEINPGQQVWERDPVGAEVGATTPFSPWLQDRVYEKNDIVEGGDSKLYISTVGNNQSNNPATDVPEWAFIQFIQDWTSLQVFFLNNICYLDGTLYRSLIDDNVGFDPETSPGEWEVLALSQAITDALYLKKTENLDDLPNKGTARNNLGLGTSATKDITTSDTDTTADRIIKVGDYGWGLNASETNGISISDLNTGLISGTYSVTGTTSNAPDGSSNFRGTLLVQAAVQSGGLPFLSQIAINRTASLPGMWFRSVADGVFSAWAELWSTENTTVDGSGFIKEASPIIKLFTDRMEGNSLVPESANLVINGVGDYTITGTLGFAKKGWYIENPKDANGNVKHFIEYTEDADGTINIKVYEPDYSTGKCAPGAPMDVVADRWIDIRLDTEITK